MPEISWNHARWDKEFDWSQSGEEWSAGWGGSEAQWFGTLFPRLHRRFPAKRVLEIAPGRGRWTKFLVGLCDELVGIDLSEGCIEFCRNMFRENASFFVNDGYSLEAAEGKFDLVFSFDSMVHAEFDVIESYVPQILDRLTDDGVAFIHHSNFAAAGAQRNWHSRAESVSAHRFAKCVEQNGGGLIHQELIDWSREGKELIDCMSLFSRRPNPDWEGPRQNPKFWDEAWNIRSNIAPYFKR
jgi:SAM-dependent methyltransferase